MTHPLVGCCTDSPSAGRRPIPTSSRARRTSRSTPASSSTPRPTASGSVRPPTARCSGVSSASRSASGGPRTVGIQVGNIRADVLGIKILDNEIYNVGDGIQLTDGPEATRPVEVLIDGNDIYLEPSRYVGQSNTTWDENAIDLKAGSDVPESTVIRGNRMWGFRRNAAPTAILRDQRLRAARRECRLPPHHLRNRLRRQSPGALRLPGRRDTPGVPPHRADLHRQHAGRRRRRPAAGRSPESGAAARRRERRHHRPARLRGLRATALDRTGIPCRRHSAARRVRNNAVNITTVL